MLCSSTMLKNRTFDSLVLSCPAPARQVWGMGGRDGLEKRPTFSFYCYTEWTMKDTLSGALKETKKETKEVLYSYRKCALMT